MSTKRRAVAKTKACRVSFSRAVHISISQAKPVMKAMKTKAGDGKAVVDVSNSK